MKVLIFSQHLKTGTGGGINRYCQEVESLFLNDKDIEVKYSPLRANPSKAFSGNRFDSQELKQELDNERPDIVHINGYTSLVIKQICKIAQKKGIKIVYTPHWHPFNTMRLSKIKQLYFNLYIKPYLKDMDAIITINNEDTAFFKKFSTKVFQHPHWISNLSISSESIPLERDKILFIGSPANSNKGFEHLLSLPSDTYNIHVVSTIGGCERPDFTLHYRISDEELVKLYKTAKLLVVPSRYEAFSYVCLEALSEGCPILVSERVRIIDYLPQDVYTIFNYGDFADFRKRLDEALQKPIVEIDDKIMKPFSKQSALNGYKHIYKTAMCKRPSTN